jgi:hypothetical protein
MNREKIGVYGMTPIALLQDERVKPNMLKVYVALASFQGGGENCWPSVAAIAERAGLKSDAVCDATEELERVGWIRKTRRANQRQTNLYEVLVDVESDVGEGENPENGETPNSEKSRKRAYSEKSRKPSLVEKNKEKNNGANAHKHTYGEHHNVTLTTSELDRCYERYGKQQTDRAIEKLSNYKEAKGRRYKSDYAALNQWVWRAIEAVPLAEQSTGAENLVFDEERQVYRRAHA